MTQYSIPKDYTLLGEIMEHTGKEPPYDIIITSLFVLEDKITFTTNKPFPIGEYPLLKLTEV